MTSSYKIDEKVLKNIIEQNIKCTNENESIKLNIYYKNRKVSNLVMKNSPNTTKLQRTNRRFNAIVSQLKMHYFSGGAFESLISSQLLKKEKYI